MAGNQVQPDYLKAYTNIGVILSDLGQMQAAEATFKQAMLLAPEDAEVHREIGKLYYSTQWFYEAITCFRQAHALAPPCAESWLDLGNACFFDDQYKAGIEALQAALVLWRCQDDNGASGQGDASLFNHRGRQQLVPLRTEQK